ncbi:MAG: rhodanese-like domain-containing protein [Chloroflexi bacterium]|nr:rhodanese-like domain-containing protein [Chloroflexota bacterium]
MARRRGAAAKRDTGPMEPFKRITVKQAKTMLDKGDSVVVDVRQLDEWRAGHAKGAIHIPVDDVLSRIDELPADKNLLFICAVGVRSALACEMAAAMGRPPERLFNIEQGTPTWIEQKLPTSYNDDP